MTIKDNFRILTNSFVKDEIKEWGRGDTNNQCLFNEAWCGGCENEAIENGYCEKHKDLYCSSCGEKATRSCAETMGLVCGSPLCDNCEHTICDNGCNSGGELPEGYGTHCKTGTQVYLSWVAQEYIKEHGEEAYKALVEKCKRGFAIGHVDKS